MKALVIPAALLAIGCATVPGEQPAAVEGNCSAERAAPLVGRQASQDLGAEALRLTGGRRLRWIRPGDAVTMDFRPDRVNVHLDGQNRVARFACG
jgi:hypothetical protein